MKTDRTILFSRGLYLALGLLLHIAGTSVLRGQEIGGLRYRIPVPGDTTHIVRLFAQAEAMRKINPDSAKVIYGNILEESRKARYYRGIMLSLYDIGSINNDEGNYEQALKGNREALVLSELLGDHETKVMLLVTTTIPYFFMGHYDTAILYSYKAMDEIGKHKVPGRIQAMVYNTTGSMWLRMKEPRKGLRYLEAAEQIAVRHNDIFGLINIRSNIGAAYFELESWDTARMYLEQVVATEKQVRANAAAIASINLGAICLKKDQPLEASFYFRQGLQYATIQKDYQSILSARHGLGNAYYKMKEYRKAEDTLLSVLRDYEQAKARDKIENVYNTLAAICGETGRYREAYRYQKLYEQTFQELFEKEKISIAGQLEAKYLSSEKDRALTENKLLIIQQENRIKDRNIWIGSAGGSILLLSILLVSLSQRNRHRQRIQAEKINNLQQGQEIERLKAIMEGEEKERSRIAHELHDGIGSQHSAMMLYLHALQNKYRGIGMTEELQQVIRLLKETADDLRDTAHNLMPESLQQQGLEQAVKTFCGRISKTRALTLDFFAYGDLGRLEQSFALALYRMIQELVQNVVKHASATRLTVMLTLIHDKVSITVEDNGVGIAGTASGGMGLSGLKRRVQELDGELIIETGHESGTTVSITFPHVKLFDQNYA